MQLLYNVAMQRLGLKKLNDFWQIFLVLLVLAPIFVVYLLLAFKNPFGVRSLIPNLEPYPDTLFYSVPAFNLASGKGFELSAYGASIKSIVPPMYSLVLAPIYFLISDVRAFYLVNLLLGIGSLSLLVLSVRSVVRDNLHFLLVGLVVGLLMASSFYFYTLPSLLMAENLVLFLSCLVVYLFLQKPRVRNVVLLNVAALMLMLTKFSVFALVLFIFASQMVRFLWSKNWYLLKWYFVSLVGAGVVFAAFLLGTGILTGHVNLQSGRSFEFLKLPANFWWYLSSLVGRETRFLWYQEYFLMPVLGILGLLAPVLLVLGKKTRGLGVFVLSGVLAQIIGMSSFYYTDSRYLITVLPFMLIGIALFLRELLVRFDFRVVLIGLGVFVGSYFLIFSQSPVKAESQALSLKKQVALNLRHTETPWNYLALQHFNDVLSNINEANEDKYLGTFLPPFYVSLFSGESYGYLPISGKQEFSTAGKDFMGVYLGDLSILEKYQELLESGKTILVSDYYLGNNRDSWQSGWDSLEENFEMELVSEGCMGACNLYHLSLSAGGENSNSGEANEN